MRLSRVARPHGGHRRTTPHPFRNRSLRITVAALAIVASAIAVPAAVNASDPLPSAAVSLGDSYLSGEAGRWVGNTDRDWGDRQGTDRAAQFNGWRWQYDRELIYGETQRNGCHRSDVAPIISAGLNTTTSINLACSGASTAHLLPASSGGRSHNGEAPQIDQLSAVAATHDVELVVIAVSGNDLGFTDIIFDCVTGYLTSTRWNPNTCHEEQADVVSQQLPSAMTKVEKILGSVITTLASKGDTDYRLILVGYPTPIPAASEFRYAETGWDRTLDGGCPFWDADADWANQELVPTFNAALSDVAAANGAEFLDLSDALAGREACAKTARQGPGDDAEWIRTITTGILQGDAEESMHPNALGQQAIGRCIDLMSRSQTGNYTCTNTPGAGPQSMILTPR